VAFLQKFKLYSSPVSFASLHRGMIITGLSFHRAIADL
jgi:hypothetical protein